MEPHRYDNMDDLYDLLKSNELPYSIVMPPIANKANLESSTFSAKIELNGVETEVFIKEINKTTTRAEEIIIHLISSGIIPADRPYRKTSFERGRENIIKFYGCYEEDDSFFIVLEKAECNFNEYYKEHKDNYLKETFLRDFHDIVKAVYYLHSNNIAHMDISENNILLIQEEDPNRKNLRVRLGDFGESEINIINNSVLLRKSHRKTQGYEVPERAKQFKQSIYNASEYVINPFTYDIHSLGIFFIKYYFNITFDKSDKITENLMKAHKKGINDGEVELALFMIEEKPKNRCDIKAILTNPIFWQYNEIFDFFQKIYYHYKDHISEKENLDVINENIKKKLFPSHESWTMLLEIDIREEIKEFNNEQARTRIDASSVFGLVKAIIYIFVQDNHFKYPEEIKRIFRNSRLITGAHDKAKYIKFWTDKFKGIELLLYYHMQAELENFHPDIYSISSPNWCTKDIL